MCLSFPIDAPLDVQLDAENRTATVKGLQGLSCNALHLCACFPNPNYPAQNWIPTGELDEVQLQGPMIPHQVYTVKAGRVSTRREFECIAEGKVRTEGKTLRATTNVGVRILIRLSTLLESR